MDIQLLKQIDRFWEEYNKEDGPDLAEIACKLVPKLIYKINELQEQLNNLTANEG